MRGSSPPGALGSAGAARVGVTATQRSFSTALNSASKSWATTEPPATQRFASQRYTARSGPSGGDLRASFSGLAPEAEAITEPWEDHGASSAEGRHSVAGQILRVLLLFQRAVFKTLWSKDR